MTFSKHLFISYAHLDDQPLPEEQQGWVGRFHAYLENFLDQSMGEKVSVWRDERLQGNDEFSDELIARVGDTAVLVAVVSPRYLKSEWCTREVSTFIERAAEKASLSIDNKSRLFKVVRIPVPLEEQPEYMRELLGYEFFVMDGERALPLDPSFGREAGETYRRRVFLMAQDIADLLRNLAHNTPTPVEDARFTVFLAETSHDRLEDRERLSAELRAHGIEVVPRRPLPLVRDACVDEVKRLLEKADLAVHLVGSARGIVPDGQGLEALPVLQNRLAAERKDLCRVVWLRDGLTSKVPEQQAFIDALRGDAEAQRGADVVTGDLEELKSVVHATLERAQRAAETPAPQVATDRPPMVWLLCDKRDRAQTLPIIKHLRAQGFDVELPVFSGSAADVRAANAELATSCDAVLLYWGAADEAWRVHQEGHLRKQAGLRDKPLRTTLTLVAEPDSEDKAFHVLSEPPEVVDGREGFDPAALADFVAALQA